MGIELLYSVVMMAISVGYQLTQAAKKKDNAKVDTQDYRKGFETVVEGQPDYLPIAYGRALVGGVRVYHNTANTYKYAAKTAADAIFQTGDKMAAGGTVAVKKYNSTTGKIQTTTKVIAPKTYTTLTNNILTGKQNEFLFFQQAICQAPISGVRDIIIDDSRYINDTSFGLQSKGTYDNYELSNAGMRVDVSLTGGIANPMLKANFKERETATFDNIAYASVVVRLDRDDPQFNGVPNIQFLVEGKKLRAVIRSGTGTVNDPYTYSLATDANRAYSNNPSLCLLDYLLDTQSGKGVSLSSINLESFYKAVQVCASLPQPPVSVIAIGHPNFSNSVPADNKKVAVGGKFYFPSSAGGSTPVFYNRRDLPLYECNLLVDTKRPIRDNIEDILSTMGDARLVWSAGEYKLNLVYPANTTELADAAVITITDDDLVLDQTVEIKYPTASDKLNYCTVKFHNEHENFKEDSISWPPKITSSYKVGGGGFKWSVTNSGFDDTTETGQFLNNYGVWDNVYNSATLTYKFLTPITLTGNSLALNFASYGGGTISIRDEGDTTLKYSLVHNGTATVAKIASMPLLLENTVYTVTIESAAVGANLKSTAASITKDSSIVWTTRSDAYTFFETINDDGSIYAVRSGNTLTGGYLFEDQGLELETEVTIPGITDPYHAIAKAEELVRTSRLTYGITFNYIMRNQYPEPGDVVKFYSENLGIASATSPVYLKIESIKLVEDTVCQITATRFSVDMLAWTTKANRHAIAEDDFNAIIPWIPEGSLKFKFTQGTLSDIVGILTWPSVRYGDLKDYILFVHTDKEGYYSTGAPIFTELGTVAGDPKITYAADGITVLSTDMMSYNVKSLAAAGAIFGVKIRAVNGRTGRMITTGPAEALLLDTAAFTLTGIVFSIAGVTRSISWTAGYITLRDSTPVAIAANTGVTQLQVNSAYVQNYIYFNDTNNTFVLTANLIDTVNYLTVCTISADGVILNTQITDLVSPLTIYVNSNQKVQNPKQSNALEYLYSSRDVMIRWADNAANLNNNSNIKDYYVTIATAEANPIVKWQYSVDKNSRELSFPYEENVRVFGGTPTRRYYITVATRSNAGIPSTAVYYAVDNLQIDSPSLSLLEANMTTYVSLASNKTYPNSTDTDAAGMVLFRKPSSDANINATGLVPVNYTVSALASDIFTTPLHGFVTGMQVQYVATATPITGLKSNSFYFVVVTDTTHFKLASSYSNAVNVVPVVLTGLSTSLPAGTHKINRDQPVYSGGLTTSIALSVETAIAYKYRMAVYDTFSNTDYVLPTTSSETAASTTVSAIVDRYTYKGLKFSTPYDTLIPAAVTATQMKTFSWASFEVYRNGTLEASVPAGSDATWTSGQFFYIYYKNDSLTLNPAATDVVKVTTVLLTAVSGRLLGTFEGGTGLIASKLTADEGKAFINGDQLLAGSVGASVITAHTLNATHLVTDSAVINNSIQIASGTIDEGHIKDYIQSVNYNEQSRTGWRLGTGKVTTAENKFISYGALDLRSPASGNYSIPALTLKTITFLSGGTATQTFANNDTASVTVTKSATTTAAISWTAFMPVSATTKTDITCSFTWSAANLGTALSIGFTSEVSPTVNTALEFGISVAANNKVSAIWSAKNPTQPITVKKSPLTLAADDKLSLFVSGTTIELRHKRGKVVSYLASSGVTTPTAKNLRLCVKITTANKSIVLSENYIRESSVAASLAGMTLQSDILTVTDDSGAVRVRLGRLS